MPVKTVSDVDLEVFIDANCILQTILRANFFHKGLDPPRDELHEDLNLLPAFFSIKEERGIQDRYHHYNTWRIQQPGIKDRLETAKRD
jgi:hypothetical protein